MNPTRTPTYPRGITREGDLIEFAKNIAYCVKIVAKNIPTRIAINCPLTYDHESGDGKTLTRRLLTARKPIWL